MSGDSFIMIGGMTCFQSRLIILKIVLLHLSKIVLLHILMALISLAVSPWIKIQFVRVNDFQEMSVRCSNEEIVMFV